MDASTTNNVGDDPTKPNAQAIADGKQTAPTVEIEDAPDPDEDDLDDLDDMLEEFSSAKLNSDGAAASSGAGIHSTTAPSAPNPSLPATDSGSGFTAEGLEDLSEEEFEKQLQAGMAELMNNLENSTDMQSQFEDIFKGLGGSAPAASGSDSQSGNAPGSSSQTAADLSQDATFQETIRRTMARMQKSGDQATAAAAAEGSEDDFLAEMMKAMKDIPGNEGSEEDFSKMLMGMMEHLTNKEILYEPMKELHDKYPDWITKNKGTLSKDDLKRYQDQQVYVAEMVAKFEESSYSDDHPADRQYIVDRMQKMQEAGSPPHDLIGDMPSAKEVLDAPDESCAPQ